MAESNSFEWTKLYIKLADRLLQYKENRTGLLSILKSVYESINMKYPFVEKAGPLDDICPFTVFGMFNKGITDDNRRAIIKSLCDKLGMTAEPPQTFDGIPVLNNMKAWFFGYKEERQPDDINNLWDMFEAAVHYADNPTDVNKRAFMICYDKARKQINIKWNLTMGLYWIRPFHYINLDERNRSYLLGSDNPFSAGIRNISKLNQLLNPGIYLDLIDFCVARFEDSNSPYKSFPELSYMAWQASTGNNQIKKTSSAEFLKWFAPVINALKALGGSGTPDQVRQQIISDLNLPDEIVNETRGKNQNKKFDNQVAWARNYLVYEDYLDKKIRGVWSLTEKGMTAPMNEEIAGQIFLKWVGILQDRRENSEEFSDSPREHQEVHYWMYAPGEGSHFWEEFYKENIMGIGWDDLDDLKQYPSKEAMKQRMKDEYGAEYSYTNSALATWQFANEIQNGDIVYAKKGLYKLVGRGIVASDYIFDAQREEYRHIRKVRWTHKGEWNNPGKAVNKTLTDITTYTDDIQKLESLFVGEENSGPEETIEIIYPDYTEADFLGEVFMDADRYDTLTNLLKLKKNIILQGAPGVGKTFAAKRLAYSIIGRKDSRRVMMVQFHQSYSYEDFIMGFRPSKDGFELKPGPFYEFCKNAQDDDELEYFFIIDEINRGNLSKIFGELLMLIERDKRGEKLRLLYSNELFSVPKNLYIIGMMNTADRSLAMIDYALRRRFAFFELEPAFDSQGFTVLLDKADYSKLYALVEQVKALNEVISKDESLGPGFRIGHSYLCADHEINDAWLESVIRFELIPLINEYWFDEQPKIDQWAKRLYGALDD
jgi:5-methylcytosine-specific restriction protein B